MSMHNSLSLHAFNALVIITQCRSAPLTHTCSTMVYSPLVNANAMVEANCGSCGITNFYRRERCLLLPVRAQPVSLTGLPHLVYLILEHRTEGGIEYGMDSE